MANLNGPYGLTLSSCNKDLIREYDVATGNGTAIFKGDAVYAVTDGSVAVVTTETTAMLGVVLDVMDTNGKPITYLTASTAGKVRVCIDPKAIYVIQTESGGTALTAAAIWDSANLNFTNAGNTTTGNSGVQLSETLAGAAASDQFRIIGKVNTPGNDWGHNVKVYVMPLETALEAVRAGL